MEILEFQGQEVEVKRKAYQKRLSLSVYPNGKIRVSANKTLPNREILKFLKKNESWVEKSIAESSELKKKYPTKKFQSGETYSYLGGDYQLQILQGKKVELKFKGDKIYFYTPVSEEDFTPEIREKYFRSFKKVYKKVAEKIMGDRIQFYAQKMHLRPKAVKFRGQKTIWGSCSPDNTISLNYKLIVAPIQVVDYVLIHELAHIRHKNHSKSFWALVEKFTDYRHYSKDWLKEHQFKADFLNKKSELE